MRKALIIILGILVLGAGLIYGVHEHYRDYAIYRARSDYSEALDKSTVTYLNSYHAAVSHAKSERDETYARLDFALRHAQKAHDDAVAKVAGLADNDSAKVEAVQKAHDELQMATGIADAQFRIDLDKVSAHFKEAMQQADAANAHAVADADAKYDAATNKIK